MKTYFICYLLFGFLYFNALLQAQPNATYNNAAWNTAQLKKYFKENNFDDSFIEAIISKGYFNPQQTCNQPDTILPTRAPDTSNAQWHKQATSYAQLTSLCHYLYTTLPMAYYDRLLAGYYNFNIQHDSLAYFLQQAHAGQQTFICTHYCQFAQLLWQQHAPTNNALVKTISIKTTPLNSAPHAINIFYFKTPQGWQGVALDALYGYLFPIKNNNSFYLVNEMQVYPKAQFSAPAAMQYAQADILNHKRFLTNRVWPCNLGKYTQRQYYHLPPNALYAFEMHEAEHIEMLDIEHFNKAAYQQLLLQAIIDNRPR